MTEFSPEIASMLLADCKRHCCICLRWAGTRMHIHHIQPKSQGGAGDYGNGIPVCLDCHAEIESVSNMGRRFTATELKLHRDRWMEAVHKNPEILARVATPFLETGPLEALYAELEFNRAAIAGENDDPFPPLATRQFHRVIATNALGALDDVTRPDVHHTYACIFRLNFFFDELTHMDRAADHGQVFNATVRARNELRMALKGWIPQSMYLLAQALGKDTSNVPHT